MEAADIPTRGSNTQIHDGTDESPMKSHLDPEWETESSQGRLLHVTKARLMWESKTPILADPGTSLCDRCKGLTIDKLCSVEGYLHSYCYWALLASAEISKCPMCLVLVNTLRGTQDDSFDLAIALINPYRRDLQVCLRAVPKECRLERDNLEVEITNMPFVRSERASMVLASDAKASEYGFRHQQQLNNVQKFEVMKQWLSLHDLPHSRPLFMIPRRLLDVGPSPNSNDGEIRLLETQGLISECGPYLALSYRWGPTNTFTTTLETLDAHRKGIMLKDMPETLQDAVKAARQLQVRYLWIDALCIVQDSREDWSEEVKKMGAIYMNAYCTIAAVSARHANDGFLEKSLAQPKLIQLGGDRDKTDETSFWISQASNSRIDIADSELSTRGWIVQERLLSRRTIHFADNGAIYLESTSELKTLDGIRDSTPLKSGGIQSMIQETALQGENSDDTLQMISSNIYRDWYQLVELYSKCSLTNGDDKIPALTGIIHEIHSFTRDKCFVGIWQQRASQCLLWLRGTKPLTYATPTRAPSWSWAGFDGLVSFPRWNTHEDDTKIQAEFAGMRFESVSDSEDAVGILSGDILLHIYGAKMLRNISLPGSHLDSGTGLRFLTGQVGDPSWENTILWEPLRCVTKFWMVYDDAGELVGWASLDREERDEVDGELDHITCIAVASHTDDIAERGFLRGFLVLFVTFLAASGGAFARVGMGQITKTSLFDQVPARDLIIV